MEAQMSHKVRVAAASGAAGLVVALSGCSYPPFPHQAALDKCFADGLTTEQMRSATPPIVPVHATTVNGEHVKIGKERLTQCRSIQKQKNVHDQNVQSDNNGTAVAIGLIGLAIAVGGGMARAPYADD